MIRKARRDGREARGNEEREKREDEKGSHCFFKSSGYDKLELKQVNKRWCQSELLIGKECKVTNHAWTERWLTLEYSKPASYEVKRSLSSCSC